MPSHYDISVSESPSDPDWDNFLIATEGGRHEQTSLWARVKALEGWRPVRCVVREGGTIVGGFQVLWRTKARLLCIGYASHGPIADREDSDLSRVLLHNLEALAGSHAVHLLLSQPARGRGDFPDALFGPAWIPNRLYPVAASTAEIDLSPDEEQLLLKMRRTRRQEIRTSLKSDLTFREGSRADLSTFFRLMCTTAARHASAPNPRSLEAIQLVWDLFRPHGLIRLFLVETGSEAIAGLLVVPSGGRAVLWKIGWSGECPEKYPSHLLYWNAMLWAKSVGLSHVDFMGIHPMNTGEGSARPSGDGPSYYKYGFRPEIVSLPRSRIYVPNRVLRMGCRLAGAAKVGHRMRMARRQGQIR